MIYITYIATGNPRSTVSRANKWPNIELYTTYNKANIVFIASSSNAS